MPPGASLVLLHDPGVEAEAFLYQAAHAELERGGTVYYYVTTRHPAAVRASMEEYGLGAGPNAGRLHFLDGFSALLGASSLEDRVLRDPTDPAEAAAALEEAARAHPEALVVVEALSTLADQAGLDRFQAGLPRLQAALRRFQRGVLQFTRWPYGVDLDALLAGFDGVVSLRGVEERVVFRQYFAVERAAWSPEADARPRLYKAVRPGGVFVYVPKILVTGPFHAGKSTFIHAVSDSAVSAEALGTTVAMDHGHVAIDGFTADLFGTPGQARFDPILKVLAAQALGVIVLVDSAAPDTFGRAKEMLNATWQQGLPAIIAANKQDAPGALRPADVARLLGAPSRVPVVGLRATEPEDARALLRLLLERIVSGSVTA